MGGGAPIVVVIAMRIAPRRSSSSKVVHDGDIFALVGQSLPLQVVDRVGVDFMKYEGLALNQFILESAVQLCGCRCFERELVILVVPGLGVWLRWKSRCLTENGLDRRDVARRRMRDESVAHAAQLQYRVQVSPVARS